MSGSLYLEDLHVGQRFTSSTLVVSAGEIKEFARQFDPQPFHLDEAEGERSLLGGFAASGWHTAALTMRLLVAAGAPMTGGVVGAGVEIKWQRPVRPGDELHVESEVLEVTPSGSKSDRGIAVVRSETLNQRGEAVQILTSRLIVPRRPSR